MDGAQALSPRRRSIALNGRGPGAMAALDLGPADRPIDIVFLHANGFNAMTYRSILAPLAGSLRILALDQRGHGATTLATVTEGRTDWYEFRDDLRALLATLDLEGVVLSGHSMGGTASILAAAAAPQRVRRLVLFDPVVMPPDLTRDAEVLRQSPLVEGARRRRAVFASREAAVAAYLGRGGFKTWPDAMVADYVEGGFRNLPSGEVALTCDPEWEASNFTSHAHDTWAAIDALRCPVEVYRAETASTFRSEEREADLIATGRFDIRTVSGTSHFLPMERPDLVREALTAAAQA
jgi:pimeloyl-ACP methyl ester carboxylesterase